MTLVLHAVKKHGRVNIRYLEAMSSKPSIIHIRRQDLQFEEQIGEGGYSTVFHAIWKSDNGDVHVAVKKPHTIDEHELEVLSKLDHPNIVKLIGANPDKYDFMLILELCELGSLRSYIDKHGNKPLPPDLFDTWSKQAARAIQYLQDQNIVHKDIKSQNYVISSGMVLKLTDLGLAKKLDKTFTNATERGTYGYMAPELLKDSKLSPTKYDIFALGVVIWEMLTGKIPYEGMEYVAVVWYVCKENKRLEIPVDCPTFLWRLLNLCWLEDYKQRPDIVELISVLETKECKSRNQWKLHSQFGHEAGIHQIHKPFFIVVHKDGNVVVYDYNICQMKMYDNKGVFKRIFGGIRGVVAAAAESDGNYFVIHSKSIEVYKPTGDIKTSIVVLPLESTAELRSLALDTNGDLLVGVEDVKRESAESVETNYLLVLRKHLIQEDGFGQMERESIEISRKIPVGVKVDCMAVTRFGTIVIFGLPWIKSKQLLTRWPQIIDKAGKVLHTLIPPPKVEPQYWRPCGVCCNADTIYVTNDNKLAPKEYGVYCYSLSGDYLGCATKEVTNPTGIAMTKDGNMMFVAQFAGGNPEQGQGKHGVKVFRRL